ncbi:MAG TPA: BREX system ATP-binding domain-containing protein [Pseudonocardia sp.]|uniref:ATP-binding protein n=1 Tax=Pseudonocardia sp. TaxID=60912 RepID=UPI002C366C72|nr:BREX system ATP-binding domain-containing protein [Pseudonocardia sp.]HTF52698.1 BREX system ATP-binding domain-containing protein [Pseudonocardia sp.]
MGSVLSPVMVGRREQLAALHAGLDAAVAGHGSTFVVIGEPGVGKTRLLREVRRCAVERGMAALVGRAVETAVPLPFRPIGEALLAACRSERVGEDPAVAPFRSALGCLVPEWSTPDTVGYEVSLLHVAEGFLRIARGLGGAGGAVVVLDDLQWADGESLAVLEYLADNVSAEPVLVVGATRSDPTSLRVGALIAMVDRRVASLLELSRLTPEQSVEMTRHCLGDARIPAEVLQLVIDRADGLPFFVEELLAALENDGALVRHGEQWVAEHPAVRAPVSFAESVRRRIGLLTPAAREVLVDAALLGRRIDPDLLATVAGADPVAVGEALQAAERRLLVEIHDCGFRFRHALTRDAVLADLPPGDRSARARRVLDRLETADSNLLSESPEVLADLAETAMRHDVAVAHLLEVGRRALRQGALTSAESAQRRALELSRGTELELEAAEALVETLGVAGRADDTFPLGEVLLARFDSSAGALDPDGSRRGAVHLALGRAAVAGTDWALAAAHLGAAGRHGAGPDLAARLNALRAVVALGEGQLDDAGRLAAEAVDAAERAGVPDLLCEALLVHGRCARIRNHEVAECAFERARTVAREAGLAHREARALAELGSVHAYRGLVTRLLEARRLAEACGAPETEAVAENHLAVAAWTRGDVDDILVHAAAVLQLARRYRLGLLVPAALIHQACAHAMRGDSAAVDALLAEAAPQITEEATQRISMHAHVRALCALAHDDLATAAREFAVAEDIVLSERPTAMPPLASMAVLLRALDGVDPRQAAMDLRRRACAGPLLEAVLAAAQAVALGRRGDHVAAASAMSSALLEMELNPFVHAVVARLVAPHATAEGWGEPMRWLDAALATFEARGLRRPAGACRALRRGGPIGGRQPGAITSRERDVLLLVAEGLPNRTIAERLYLSSRTVEKHVERLLAKTGSSNRAQLATYALRQDENT